jgi:hypothetical protein
MDNQPTLIMVLYGYITLIMVLYGYMIWMTMMLQSCSRQVLYHDQRYGSFFRDVYSSSGSHSSPIS